MIDTVRFMVELTPKRPLPLGWKERRVTTTRGTHQARFDRYTHQASGMRVMRDPKDRWSVEVSLCRVLHGSNLKLIASQGDLRRAWKKVDSILREFAADYHKRGALRRVDLCWYVCGRPKDIVGAHLGLRHPSLKGKVIIYLDESIIWESKKPRGDRAADERLQFYDKILQKYGKRPGYLVRIELQLRDEALCRRLNPRRPATSPGSLDFGRCYDVLRGAVLELNDAQLAEPWRNGFNGPARKRLEELGVFWTRLLPAAPRLPRPT